jgi:hypothetical protein
MRRQNLAENPSSDRLDAMRNPKRIRLILSGVFAPAALS